MPTPNRTVFGRFFVYSSKLVNDTTYQFWLSSAQGDPTWKVDVDLAMNSSRALAGDLDWNDVQVDAGDDDSGSRLLGWWPDKTLTGVIYLTEKFMGDNGLTLPPPGSEGPPPLDTAPLGMDYEFQTAIYRKNVADVRAGRRYHGFFARVITTGTDIQGIPRALVSFYHAGTSQAGTFVAPATTQWVDLKKLAHFDANVADGGLTEIAMVGDEGKVFISAAFVNQSLQLVRKVPAVVFLSGKKPCQLQKVDLEFF